MRFFFFFFFFLWHDSYISGLTLRPEKISHPCSVKTISDFSLRLGSVSGRQINLILGRIMTFIQSFEFIDCLNYIPVHCDTFIDFATQWRSYVTLLDSASHLLFQCQKWQCSQIIAPEKNCWFCIYIYIKGKCVFIQICIYTYMYLYALESYLMPHRLTLRQLGLAQPPRKSLAFFKSWGHAEVNSYLGNTSL